MRNTSSASQLFPPEFSRELLSSLIRQWYGEEPRGLLPSILQRQKTLIYGKHSLHTDHTRPLRLPAGGPGGPAGGLFVG
jgi:hypothetical protein